MFIVVFKIITFNRKVLLYPETYEIKSFLRLIYLNTNYLYGNL